MLVVLPSPSIIRREDFGELLNLRDLTGAAVEIGTHRAEFSEKLLLGWRGKTLYCVDPWVNMDDYDRDVINGTDREADYKIACDRLKRFGNRVEIIRDTSENAVKRFAAGTFDFVYIDGNHEARHVKHDIEQWGFRVKSGGIIAGHDFNGDWEKEVRPEVERAAESMHTPVYFMLGAAASWMMIKP